MIKQSQWMFAGMAVVALLVGIALIAHCKSPAPSSRSNNKEKKRVDQQQESVQQAATDSSPSKAAPLSTPSKPQAKEQWMSGVVARLNHLPITFYGKVVDQYGTPVEGAKVRGGVMVQKAWMDGTIVEYWTQTDGSGSFSFSGIKGRDISISAYREGYVFKQVSGPFFYSAMWQEKDRHKPDPRDPVVFIMWKLKGPEPMMSGQVAFKIIPDGRAYSVNFFRSTSHGEGTPPLKERLQSPYADLKVRFYRAAEEVSWHQRNFEWSFVLEGTDGGLIEVPDTRGEKTALGNYLNEAPAEGYMPRWEWLMPAAESKWGNNCSRTFYFTSRKGRVYGRMIVTMESISHDPKSGNARIQYWLNPYYSRNLEFDPEKQTGEYYTRKYLDLEGY